MTLKRRDFIKKAGIGLISGPFILRSVSSIAQENLLSFGENSSPFNCVLAPSQMGGPFYKDPKYNRRDITEGKITGLPFKIKVQVLGVKDCKPIRNCVVNIWHCKINGSYSEFGAVQGNPEDNKNETWLRGYQITDRDGYVTFDTIFPGWYPGRATHIHFDAHIGFVPGGVYDNNPDKSSTYVSQMYFDNAIKTKVYKEIQEYKSKGDNPTGTHNDSLYQGSGAGAKDLLLTFDETDFPNSLSAEFTIGLNMLGTDTTSIEDAKGLKHFSLEQNYPNPFSKDTTIPFTLKSEGTVTLSVFSATGELVAQLVNRKLPAGEYTVDFDKTKTGIDLPGGLYMFDMMFHNKDGMFRQNRNMIIV